MRNEVGRKPKSPADRRVRWTVRLSPTEIQAFERAARRAGVPVSTWVRNLARAAAGLPAEVPPKGAR